MAQPASVVLITGASRGLGRGIAQRVAEMGCSIVVNYAANEAAAKETIDLCRKKQTRPDQEFMAVKGDVGKSEDRAALVKTAIDKFGRIDALVNNAGVGPKERLDLVEMKEDSFQHVVRTNLEGPHFLTQRVADYWLKEKPRPLLPGGLAVVFISSVSAEMVSTNRGEYCMSKAGLSMCAKLWATRLGPEGILVCEIRPGIMATDMTGGVRQKYDALMADGAVPQKRWGEPDDVGLTVKAILSGHMPFSAGAVIHVDGGLTIPRL
jgi:NAD(P)-dependent dehydrogenase (short-subunit alcohol dehydrogenase family)